MKRTKRIYFVLFPFQHRNRHRVRAILDFHQAETCRNLFGAWRRQPCRSRRDCTSEAFAETLNTEQLCYFQLRSKNNGRRFTTRSAQSHFVGLRALQMAKWDVCDAYDAWDNGFLKFVFGASRWNLANHRQRASHRNQNRRIQCNRQGASRKI